MYTKDEFNKYYLAGKAIAEPIHVDIDYQDLTFCDRCWYIGYSDYVKFVKQHSFTVQVRYGIYRFL